MTTTPPGTSPSDAAETGLLFDPMTVLLGLLRRWHILLAYTAVAAVLGIATALRFGTRSFEAETVLVHNPLPPIVDTDSSPTKLDTLLRLVAIEPNLAEMRKRLGLPYELKRLAAACEVDGARKTDLMVLHVRWPTAKQAADIANVLRDVFLESQRDSHRREVRRYVNAIEERLAGALRQLEAAQDALHAFVNTHSIVDFDQRARRYIDEMRATSDLYEEADKERLALDHQKAELDRRLDRVIVPSARYTMTGLGQQLRGLLDKTRDLAAASAAAKERAARLKADREHIKGKLDQLPRLQRELLTLRREVVAREADRGNIEATLAKARGMEGSDECGFNIVTEAGVPARPSRSNRRMIAIGVAALGSILGLVVTAGMVLADTTMKSRAEVEMHLRVPVLAALPHEQSGHRLFPGREDSVFAEDFRIMARTLRQRVPGRGARVLVTCATHGEGATLVASNLAACFGRQDERVLLVSSAARQNTGPDEFYGQILADDATPKGLGEFLSYDVHDVDDILHPTLLPGVDCIPHATEAVVPEMLACQRMRELLDDVSRRYSLVLLDAPPVLPYADAQALTQWSDSIVFVIRSQHCPLASLREAVNRLKVHGVPFAGAVLTDVADIYMDKYV